MKNKYELNFYSFYDINGMEKHLEIMAEKGWFLYKIVNCIWCYKKDRARKIKYKVSYFAKASMFEPEKTEGQQTFQEFCEYAGWKLTAENAKFQVFMSEKENPIPIYTDPESEIESILSISKMNIAMNLLLMLLLTIQALFYISSYRNNPIEFISNNFMIFSFCAIILIIVYFAFELIGFYLWKYKAKKESCYGILTHTSRNSRKFNKYITITSVLLIFIGAITSNNSRQFWLVLVNVAALLLLMIIINGVRLCLKKRKVEKEINIAVTIIVDILLAAVFAGVITYGGIKLLNNNDNAKMLVTAEDLTVETGEKSKYEVQISSSFIADKNQGWQFKDNGNSLSYKVIYLKIPHLENYILNKMLHEKDDMGSYENDYDPENPFYVYDAISADAWNADLAWQLKAYDKMDSDYILKYDHMLVHVSFNWNLTNTQKLKFAEIIVK